MTHPRKFAGVVSQCRKDKSCLVQYMVNMTDDGVLRCPRNTHWIRKLTSKDEWYVLFTNLDSEKAEPHSILGKNLWYRLNDRSLKIRQMSILSGQWWRLSIEMMTNNEYSPRQNEIQKFENSNPIRMWIGHVQGVQQPRKHERIWSLWICFDHNRRKFRKM
jgi:hypothetical protein